MPSEGPTPEISSWGVQPIPNVGLQSQYNQLSESMTNNLPITVTCLVLIDAQETILATQRPEGKALGGLWEFPGGKVEEGEDPEEALRREIREELCLELGELTPLEPVEHTYPFGTIRLLPYLSRCEARPAIHLTEHTALRWLKLEEAGEIEWAPADLPVLDQLRLLIKSRGV